MLKDSNKRLLVLASIFVFAFIYRIILMARQTFPSGSDIGLHNSVIYSIIGSGNVNFFNNFYQMGGGSSFTFPGYHIFVSQIMLMSGMPEYMVHVIIVALVSSIIVLVSYLITRAVWKESAALIVAFLVAISRFDIEMLLWGGYPNVITLMLIPLTFYLYIQKDRFSLLPFYASTAILTASIFLTHTLSTLVFASIILAMVIIGVIFAKKIGTTRRTAFSWILPLVFGAIIVSPFLVNAVPAYLANGEVSDIIQATLSTRILPMEIILPLFAIIPLFFLLSKKYQKHFFTVPTILLVLWLLVPLIFTQGYLYGFLIDYNRFLYFVLTPVVILMGVFIDHGSGFFARVIDTYRTLTSQLSGPKQVTHRRLTKLSAKIDRNLTRNTIYAGFIIGLLLVCFAAIPIFMTPYKGIEIQKFYQVMSNPLYDAMNWAKENTPENARFVSDANYGWWFSGFAQRPTISAVDPQYLALSREFEPAQFARYLLDTDYLIDNNLTIQVREDGGYLARHNPEILVKLNWTYFPYSFFNFNSNQTIIKYEVNGNLQSVNFNQLPVKEMHMENDTAHATIAVIRGNEYFNYTQLTTVYRGLSFVNMTIKLDATAESVSLDWLYITVQSKGVPIDYESNDTIALIDEGVKAFGQLIFKENQPERIDPSNSEIDLDYRLDRKSQGEIQIFATAYPVTDDLQYYENAETISNFFNPIITENMNSTPEPVDIPLGEVFDYQAELKSNNISYIAIRDSDIRLKFLNDPAFNLVFINNEVAIFEVKKQP
jgi:hypothetical protein